MPHSPTSRPPPPPLSLLTPIRILARGRRRNVCPRSVASSAPAATRVKHLQRRPTTPARSTTSHNPAASAPPSASAPVFVRLRPSLRVLCSLRRARRGEPAAAVACADTPTTSTRSDGIRRTTTPAEGTRTRPGARGQEAANAFATTWEVGACTPMEAEPGGEYVLEGEQSEIGRLLISGDNNDYDNTNDDDDDAWGAALLSRPTTTNRPSRASTLAVNAADATARQGGKLSAATNNTTASVLDTLMSGTSSFTASVLDTTLNIVLPDVIMADPTTLTTTPTSKHVAGTQSTPGQSLVLASSSSTFTSSYTHWPSSSFARPTCSPRVLPRTATSVASEKPNNVSSAN